MGTRNRKVTTLWPQSYEFCSLNHIFPNIFSVIIIILMTIMLIYYFKLCLLLICAGPCGGLLGTGLCVQCFFDYRKQPSFRSPDLSWVPMGRFKQLLIREGTGGDARPGRNKTVKSSLGQGPISPSVDTHNIFELFYRYWNPHQVREVND